MIKIGDFATLFNVSIKTVRFYEDKGLLTPCYVNIYSGYRYYDEDNIKTMSRIIYLKNLGLSLDDIRNFNYENINNKIIDYENQIKKLYKNINTLESLSNMKGDEEMKTFVNDENAIGKWILDGVAQSKDDYLKKKLLSSEDVGIKEIYLMEGGSSYWVISWTNGIIYICDEACPYEIIGDLMYVKFIDFNDNDNYKMVVYKKIDNKKYTKEDIMIKDNTELEFVSDQNAIGYYTTCDMVSNIDSFNPNERKYKSPFYLINIAILPDGKLTEYFNQKEVINISYTKGYIINKNNSTTSKYILKEINNETYLIMEWKSGDYTFGKMINGYYVLRKNK